MIAVFSIDNEVEYRSGIGKKQTENIDKILKSLLGDDLTGKDGERYFYHYIDETHFLERFKNDFFPYTNENLKNEFEAISLKLLAAELNANGGRNKKITKGLLFIRFLHNKLIFLKLEESISIDHNTFEITQSYGIDKKYYKAAIFEGNKNNIIIVDKNSRVANYWSDKFLDLIKTRDDKKNTYDLIELINKRKILNADLDTSKKDFYYKALVKYIKYANTFDIDTFISSYSYSNLFDDKNQIFDLSQLKEIDESFVIDDQEKQRLFKTTIKTSNKTSIKLSNISVSVLSRELVLDKDNKQIILKIDSDLFNGIEESIEIYMD